MQNPQPTDPHMRIEHHIWETLAHCDLSGAEFRVLLAILRHTWGWGKKSDTISQTELGNATGITDRSYLTRITKELVDRHMIVKTSSWGKKSTYQFDKHYDRWTIARIGSTDAPSNTDAQSNGSTDAPSVRSTDAPSNSLGVDTLLYESNLLKQHESKHAASSKTAPKSKSSQETKAPLLMQYLEWKQTDRPLAGRAKATDKDFACNEELMARPDMNIDIAMAAMKRCRKDAKARGTIVGSFAFYAPAIAEALQTKEMSTSCDDRLDSFSPVVREVFAKIPNKPPWQIQRDKEEAERDARERESAVNV